MCPEPAEINVVPVIPDVIDIVGAVKNPLPALGLITTPLPPGHHTVISGLSKS